MGRLFATLRSLSGLSLAEAARAARLSPEDIENAEWGYLTGPTTAALTSLYGLKRSEFVSEGLGSPEPSGVMSVFLLHGAFQDFRATDLIPLERSLRAARVYGALSDKAAGSICRRMRFVQAPVAGPRPRDAALQGYALAGRVRAELGLGYAPLPDLRAILEEHLAVAVLVDELATSNLRAASVLDGNRTAAAVLLATDDVSRARNPLLARVYLAHELGHLLFDRARPGCVQVALDDQPGAGSTHEGGGAMALMESRAKGFAAEMLLPREGIARLLGAPRAPESSLASAARMVLQAAEHFATPWEIAVNHLANRGFIDHELRSELLEEHPTRGDRILTELPAPGAPPLFFEGLPSAFKLWGDTEVTAPAAPDFVRASIAAAQTAAQTAVKEALERAYADADAGRLIEATDALVWRLDRWLVGGEFEQVRRVLDRLDVDRLPTPVLTGVLTLTSHAREHLGEVRERFFARVMRALEVTWGVPPEPRAKIAARLA